jgi:signal peptidase II
MLYILIVVAVVLLETKIKNYIEQNKQHDDKEEILDGKIILTKHHNEGAFLNFMENKKEMVKTISGVLLGLILLLFAFILPKKGNKLMKLGLALALGGAISNVTDRFKRGYVVDYFSFNCKKLKNIIFNLADMAIFLGSILMLLSSIFKSEGSPNESAE